MTEAINVVPGMTRTTILHAGPPVTSGKHVRGDERRGYRRAGV